MDWAARRWGLSIQTRRMPNGQWTAIDNDTYDCAPDAGRARAMGWGDTEADAISDLLEQLEE